MANLLINLNTLRAFEATARKNSFTLAAQELCVTQAAVSHQVRQIEEVLGVRLFERAHRRVTLTDAAARAFFGRRAGANARRIATSARAAAAIAGSAAPSDAL